MKQQIAKEHEKPLLGENACLQGKNEDTPKEVVRGPQEEEEDQSTPYLG